MKFEDFPNEIFIDCFEYFHPADLFYSFARLNHRFNRLLRTLPLHLNFQDVEKASYDVLCEQMLANPDIQERVYSVRLSNENTPGQIEDFLSKFSLDQFVHLRSLTFIDLHENNIQSLKVILGKLSQITTLHLSDSEMKLDELEPFLVSIDQLQTLSVNSNMAFVQQIIPIRHLTLSTLSLNEICRLVQYTPCLDYLNIACVRSESLSIMFHGFSRLDHLKNLILADVRAEFDDLRHFLWNLSNVQNLTIGSSYDRNMLDAPRWERLIKSSLPHLKSFRFKLMASKWPHQRLNRKAFARFQTKFWLQIHQWCTECSVDKKHLTIYSIPYPAACGQISLTSHRCYNPSIDRSQTFKHVRKLVVSPNDLFEHGDYYFPNVTSLIITRSLQFSSENDEERVIELLVKLMNFAHLKHLEFPMDCQTQRPTLFFQILDLAPQLSSLRTKPCFIELLLDQPETRRYLNNNIRKLDISNYSFHHCKRLLNVRSPQQLLPNLEQLTISIVKSRHWSYLLNQSSTLSTINICLNSGTYWRYSDRLKDNALKYDCLFSESSKGTRYKLTRIFSVWRKNKKP